MANVKISQLPSGSIPTALDIIPIVDYETLITTGVRSSYLLAYISSSIELLNVNSLTASNVTVGGLTSSFFRNTGTTILIGRTMTQQFEVTGVASFRNNVGIGTGSNASYKLNILATSSAGVVKIQNRNPTAGSRYAAIDFYDHNDIQQFSFGYADPGVGGIIGGKAYFNSTTGAPFRIEGTGRISFDASTDISGNLGVEGIVSGSGFAGTDGPLNLYGGSSGAQDISFYRSATRVFYMDSNTGYLRWVTDNLYDVGPSTSRPRDLFIGRNIEVGKAISAVGAITASVLAGFSNQTLQIDAGIWGYSSVYTQLTASHTLSNADNGKVVMITSPSQATLTVPTSLTGGFGVTILQAGTGSIFVTGALGVTVFNRSSHQRTSGQYAMASLLYLSGNAFVFAGDTML